MKHNLLIIVIALLLPAALSVAQTMDIHRGEEAVKVSLTEMDSITFSSDTVNAPANLFVSLGKQGIDAGGDLWNAQVTVLVQDIYNNPVADGWTVEFTVDPDIATLGDAETGNESLDGQITPGAAFGTLTYASEYSLDEVEIHATIALEHNSPSATGTFVLPLNDAVITISSDPENWNYRNMGDGENAVIQVSAYVVDSHETEISGAHVRFFSTKGRFYTNAQGQTERMDAFTGPDEYPEGIDNDPAGWANRYLIIPIGEAFPDPRILESLITVWAEVIGPGEVVSTRQNIEIVQ
ncbi:hypothetical protein ACFLQJ_00130 [Calditrichota bacterium]